MTTKSAPTPYPVDAAALAALVSGHHGSPHDILGPHPHNKQVTIRTMRPMAKSITIIAGKDTVEMTHEHEGIWVGILDQPEVTDYTPRCRVRRRQRDRLRRPLPLPAHPRRDGPAPDLRRPPRGTLDRARCARPPLRHTPRRGGRHVVRGLGAERPGCPGHGRLQLLGRPRAPDAVTWDRPVCGNSSCPTSARAPCTSTKCSAPTASGARRPTRWPRIPKCRRSAPRWCGSRSTVGRQRLDDRAGQAAGRVADERLRGPPRIVAQGPLLHPARRRAGRATSPTSASPTSNCCRSWSIRSAVPGAIR